MMRETEVDKSTSKMKEKQYVKELRKYQTELCLLQE